MAADDTLIPNEPVAYAKARYQYCQQIFNREEERRETLEKKAQFYLSFVTLFLGAVFFNPEFLEKLARDLADPSISVYARVGLSISLAILGVSLFVALIAILKSMSLQKFKGDFPKNLFDALFNPASTYLDDKSEGGFYLTTAMALAIALENNVVVNDQKSKWVRLASYCIITGVCSLSLLLGIFTCLAILR